MEKVKECLKLTDEESEFVTRLIVPSHRVNFEHSFYENYILKGIRVDRVESGQAYCTFKVPPRHVDRNGNLAPGAIANLVDELGAAAIHLEGLPMSVSVDMSISFLSSAKVDDELEITARALGQKGGYFGTHVLIRNRANGEVVAEGRHSLFRKSASRL
ncbi:Acyl-CoA hydrolase [Bertholletia excelsa]